MSQSQPCSCANRDCFHGGCACFTKEGVCSKDCKCRGNCENILGNDKMITEKFAEHTKNKAADAAAQDPADQAAAQPKPLPAQEPESKCKPCSCDNRDCFHGGCACFTKEGVCSKDCKCRGNCENILGNDKMITEKFAEYTKNKAADAAAQDAADQAAAQPMPLPAQEPESKCEKARNTSPSAVKMKFAGYYEGCSCRTNGCHHHRCPCYTRNVGCTSKCKYPATVCVNPIGVRGDESNAEEGGEGCKCQSSRCITVSCSCVRREARCTLKCRCRLCENEPGNRGADKSKARPGGQGGTSSSSSRAVESVGKRPKHG